MGDELTSNADAGSGREVKKSVTEAPEEARNDAETVESTILVAEGNSIAPITPIPAREIRDIRVPRPVIVECRLAEVDDDAGTSKEPECCCSPRTPKQGVFDPFAPGPDHLLLAPKLMKTTGESRINVARQLDFDSSSSGESNGKTCSDEEKLLESDYNADSLVVIVPSSAERDAAFEAEPDGFKTPPPLVPCFNETAKKCPDAPMKQGRPTSKRLLIDASLCRKLEF